MRSRSAGAVQQTIMRAEGIYELLSALPAPTAIVALLTIVFGIALWTRRAAEWTVAARHHAGVGVTALVYGLASMWPGVDGNIVYGRAQVADFYFPLPAAFGVPVAARRTSP
jgi:hypothetical protein